MIKQISSSPVIPSQWCSPLLFFPLSFLISKQHPSDEKKWAAARWSWKISSNLVILSQWCSSFLLFPLSFLICSLSIFPSSLQPGDVKKWHKRFPSSPPITLQFSFCPFLISYQSSHSTPLSSHSNGRNNSPSAPFLSFFLISFFNHFFLNTTFILSTYTINLSFSHSM